MPSWILGEGRSGISIDILIDLMSSDSASYDNILNDLLGTEWLDGTVIDYFYLNFYAIYQPNHAHSFAVS
jgi:hypothetical protein